jgi:hypothetical protein
VTVRIAVAGAGLIGQRHIEEIDASASAELAAIVDPFPAAAEIAAKFSVPIYSSLAEMFADNKPDGVILATPNQMHVDGGRECVAAGVPVIVPCCVIFSWARLIARAMPKSASTAWPPEKRMFSGLMSRCTTPRSCA